MLLNCSVDRCQTVSDDIVARDRLSVTLREREHMFISVDVCWLVRITMNGQNETMVIGERSIERRASGSPSEAQGQSPQWRSRGLREAFTFQ